MFLPSGCVCFMSVQYSKAGGFSVLCHGRLGLALYKRQITITPSKLDTALGIKLRKCSGKYILVSYPGTHYHNSDKLVLPLPNSPIDNRK